MRILSRFSPHESHQRPQSSECRDEIFKLLRQGDYSEQELEDALISMPDLFEPRLRILARQMVIPVAGRLDLIGFHEIGDRDAPICGSPYGLLAVYELKAGRASRSGIRQCLNYAAALRPRPAQDIANRITASSMASQRLPSLVDRPLLTSMIRAGQAEGRWIRPILVCREYSSEMAAYADDLRVEIITVDELLLNYEQRLAAEAPPVPYVWDPRMSGTIC